MITAELFSQGPRPAAMSVAVLVNWSANFFVGIGFPTMQTTLENYTFLPFSMFLALFWCFTYRKVPETKNKTFDEIATLFRIGHKQRSLMNCVNSISQMNSVSCEHSSLIPQEKKGPPPEQGQGGPEKRPPDEGEDSSKEYPLLPGSCPSTPRSRSPQSLRSPSQLSEYSTNHHGPQSHSPDHRDMSDNSQDTGSPPPPHMGHPGQQYPPHNVMDQRMVSDGHPVGQGPPPPHPHQPVFQRPYLDCNSKNAQNVA